MPTEGSEGFAHELFIRERDIGLGGVGSRTVGKAASPCSRARWPRLPGYYFQACASRSFFSSRTQLQRALGPAWYCSLLTFSIQSTALPSSASRMAICIIAVLGDAPCQCFSPGSNQTTSPGWISSTGPPRARLRTCQEGRREKAPPAGGCARTGAQGAGPQR